MKCMITGGNRGLGQWLCEHFAGDSYSRSNGFDITKQYQELADISLDYDLFINNAFDGPFQEEWADFGQVKLLQSVASAWQKNNHTGYIINIGSVGGEEIVAPEPSWETYRVSKTALKHHSRQWTRAFKRNMVRFRTSLMTLDRLDTPLSRSRNTWTGNGHDLSNVEQMIRLCLESPPNTCVEEIVAWVNFEYKHM